MKFAVAALAALSMLFVQPALAQTKPAAKPAASDMQEFARQIKADKKALVAANMQLTEAEARKFWPVYEAYQKDLQGINERLAKAIVAYADAWKKGPLSNESAKKLISEAVAIEEAEVKLRRSYLPKLEKAIAGMKVARYLQIENKIRAVIKYELAANIPLVE